MIKNKEEAKTRIEKLKKEINKYRYAGHVLDKNLISEQALDSLKKELFDLELTNPELITRDSPTQRVAGVPLKEFKKVRHVEPMYSLNDAFTEKDIMDWIGRMDNYLGRKIKLSDKTFYCELKIDGLGIELSYGNGFLRNGSTRGDGITGEDVTQNLKTIEAIPLKLSASDSELTSIRELIVRGEVFLTKKEFERINKEQKHNKEKEYANPRNVAAGSIRQLDPKIAASRKLDSFQYDIILPVDKLSSRGILYHSEEHEALHKLGFKVNPHNKICKNLKEVFAFRNYWENHREKLPYEIDGVVVLINLNAEFDALGIVGKAPRGAVAYKFSPRETTATVKNIAVGVGRTGVLTPVAELEPVLVGGVTVSHATLHNADEIGRLGLKIGDTVIISRAGDVIPKITKVLHNLRTGTEKSFHMPRLCPVDNAPVIRDGVAYKCSNMRCGARNREGLYHFVSRNAFNIEGMGPKIIDRFLDEGLISDAADIFSLKEGDIAALPRFGNKSAENLIKEIVARKKIKTARFIYSLGILHVGEETSVLLARELPARTTPGGLAKKLKNYSMEDLQKISDIGPKVGESIRGWFNDEKNMRLISKFEKTGIHLENKESAGRRIFSGKSFVLTGTLRSMSRDEAKEKIRARGGDISESVSKKTGYVVVGEEPGSKFEKAKRLDVKIVDEKEFIIMLS